MATQDSITALCRALALTINALDLVAERSNATREEQVIIRSYILDVGKAIDEAIEAAK